MAVALNNEKLESESKAPCWPSAMTPTLSHDPTFLITSHFYSYKVEAIEGWLAYTFRKIV